MKQDDRGPFSAALRGAREAAFAPGEYAGQESFMRASDIRRLARRARIGPGMSVLDVCCGVAGAGRLIAAELGCDLLGVDYSASALELARAQAGDLPCRFEQRHVPPLPDDSYDVVLLLETMLAFRDKHALLADVARVLNVGGRFAFTVEAGVPLSASERTRMPDADTVWLIEMATLGTLLTDVGLTVTWQEDQSASHRETAAALVLSFRADSTRIASAIGQRALVELLTAHQLWCKWLASGRVRKFAIVAEKR